MIDLTKILSDEYLDDIASCIDLREIADLLVKRMTIEEGFEFASILLNGNMEKFVRIHATYEDAINTIIIADERSWIEDLNLGPTQIVEAISLNHEFYDSHAPNTIGYLLAMEYPDIASGLLKELEYWKNNGRIT